MDKRKHFFIVGAMRSGTTYLATILDEHPQICMAKPIIPEPKFFLKQEEYSLGLDYYGSKYFSDCKRAVIYGEKSARYCEHEDVAKRIKKYFPESKIIFILRSPVYRALSNYYYSFQNKLETRSLAQVFLEQSPEQLYNKNTATAPFSYLQRGRYLDYIETYEKYFKPECIKVVIMEDFVVNKQEIKNIYKFLEVSPDFIPPSLNKIINSNNVDLEKVDPSIVEILFKYYKKHIIALEKHLKISLYKWKNEI